MFYVFSSLSFALRVKQLSILDIIIVAIGAIIVYGAKKILTILKVDITDNKVIICKLIGLAIALTGIFRILYSANIYNKYHF